MRIIEQIKTNEELQKLRVEWKEKKNTSFPPYNYDEYHGIEDYKEKIQRKLNNQDASVTESVEIIADVKDTVGDIKRTLQKANDGLEDIISQIEKMRSRLEQ